MSEIAWLALTAGCTYAFGNIAKRWPRVPKCALPVLVLAIGYAATLLR